MGPYRRLWADCLSHLWSCAGIGVCSKLYIVGILLDGKYLRCGGFFFDEISSNRSSFSILSGFLKLVVAVTVSPSTAARNLRLVELVTSEGK